MRTRVSNIWRLACLVSLFFASLVSATADITLRMTVWDGDESFAILKKEAENFEVAHPGIHVKLEAVFYNDYFTKLLAQFAGGAAPDVAMMDPGDYLKFAKRGAFLPLEQFYHVIPGFDIKDYYEPIVKAHSANGHLWVLPRDIAPEGLFYYNKKAFDEAGIPYPDGTWTWDFKIRPELKEKDFLWVLQQLTKRDANGKVKQFAVSSWDPHGLVDLFLYSQGGRYVDDPVEPTRVLFDDPKDLAAHRLMVDIFQKYHFAPSPSELASVIQTSSDQLFSSGRCAMYVCGIWDAIKIRRVLKPGTPQYFDWDIAMAPAYAHGVHAVPTGGSGYALMSSTEHPKEAWELAAWMAGPPGMTAMAKASIAQPAIRKLALTNVWCPDASTPRDEQDPRNRIITDQEVSMVVFGPSASSFSELFDFLKAKEDAMWSGTITPEEGLKEAQQLAQNRLNDLRKQEVLPPFNWPAAGVVIAGLIAALLGWVYLPKRRKEIYTRRDRAENRAAYWFLSPWIIGTLVFTLGPMLVALVLSTSDWDILTPAKFRGAGNYAEVFTKDPRFWKSLEVTGIYTAISVPIGIAIALALALLLNTKVRGIAFFRTCFYLPALGSVVAGSLVMQKLFQQDGGLVNSLIYGTSGKGNLLGIGTVLNSVGQKQEMANWLGNEHLALGTFILISFWSVGGGMMILLAGLQGIPQFYYEAATLDGASAWRRFRTVTFPLLTPALFFVLITGVIGSFQIFTQVFIITSGQGSPNDSTRVLMLSLYDNAFKYLRMGYSSALGWVLFMVILVFTVIQFQLNRKVYYEADVR